MNDYYVVNCSHCSINFNVKRNSSAVDVYNNEYYYKCYTFRTRCPNCLNEISNDAEPTIVEMFKNEDFIFQKVNHGDDNLKYVIECPGCNNTVIKQTGEVKTGEQICYEESSLLYFFCDSCNNIRSVSKWKEGKNPEIQTSIKLCTSCGLQKIVDSHIFCGFCGKKY